MSASSSDRSSSCSSSTPSAISASAKARATAGSRVTGPSQSEPTMPSPMRRRRRPPSVVRSAYNGRIPTTSAPRRATRTCASPAEENSFHQEEIHGYERNTAPGWLASMSCAQSACRAASGPACRAIWIGDAGFACTWTLRMREDVLHGPCHEVDRVIVERLVDRQLEDLAAESHDFGEFLGVAAEVVLA